MKSNFRTDFPDDNFLKYYKELQNAEPKKFHSLLKSILNEYPRCPLFYFKLAEFQFNQNDLRKSIETIVHTLELYADNLRTNYSYYNKSLIGDLKIQLFLLRVKVLDRLSAPSSEIKEALFELKEESERNPCENLEEITLIIKKYSDKYFKTSLIGLNSALVSIFIIYLHFIRLITSLNYKSFFRIIKLFSH